MDILQEWLESTILRELGDGLNWLESSSEDSAIDTSHFEDDGSTLKVKISKPKGGVVQMTKLISFEKPTEAWVSDTVTRLQVIFATSAVHRYRHETRQSQTQYPLGGLLSINEFEILATHSGPRPRRLTILIKDFQTLGSVGSGAYGFPRALIGFPEVIKLLDRLQMLRSKGHCKGQTLNNVEDLENRDSPVRTQGETKYSSPNSSDCSRSASQEIFATQVPNPRLVESLGFQVRDSNGTSHQGKFDDSPAPSLSSKFIMKNPLKSATTIIETFSSMKNANIFANANTNANASATRLASKFQTPSSPSRKLPGMLKSQPNQRDRASELLELLPKPKAPKSDQPSTVHAPVVGTNDNSRSSANKIVSSELHDQVGKAQNVSTRNATISERQVSPARSTTEVIPCTEEFNGEAEVQNLAKSVSEVERVSLPVSLRIKRREVKISKDQEERLNYPTSWIPAEPGQRQPFGNIPVTVLQSISDLAEGYSRDSPVQNHSVIQPFNKAESTTTTSGLTSESEAGQDSESEIPVSSKDWPPSSPPADIREQLPPDSSIQAPSQANESEEEEGEENSVQKQRKPSNFSASSIPAIIDLENVTPTANRSGKTFRLSPALIATPSRQDIRDFEPSESAEKPHGTKSDSSDSHSIIQKPETLLAPSQETAHGTHDQHKSKVRPSHLTPRTVIENPESKDHGSQEMVNKSLERKGESLNAILYFDANATIDPPENTRDSVSPRVEIASVQSPNNPGKIINYDHFLQQAYHDTAIGYDEPILQVKATPYVNGHSPQSRYINQNNSLSPSRKKDSLPNDHDRFHEPKVILISPTVIESSTAHISPPRATDDILSEFNSSEICRKNPTSTDSVPNNSRVRVAAEYRNSGISCSSPNDTTHVEDTFINTAVPPATSSGDYVAVDSPTTAQDNNGKTKRKLFESQPGSPESRKRHKQMEAFTLSSSEDPPKMMDPSILGHHYRQDFYNSRKSLTNSHANEAPNSPNMVMQSLMPDSHTKSVCNEGLLGEKEESDAPLTFAPRKETPVPDPENDDMSGVITASEDEEQLEKDMLEERHPTAKTGWSSNATLETVEGQTTDHGQVHDVEQDFPIPHVDCLAKADLFHQFKAAYPSYTATSEQFVAICRKIERLVKDGHMIHQYLWDDFIIRHRTEYPTYLSFCAEKADDPIPYEKFYHSNIVKPLFTNGVVKPENIHQVCLPSQQVVRSSDQQHQRQRENFLGVENVADRKSTTSSTSPSKGSESARRLTPPEGPVDFTIDLTSDEDVSLTTKKQHLIDVARRKSPRSLPWVTRRSREESTPTKNALSRASSSNHISRSPLHLIDVPRSKSRRSLPWVIIRSGGESTPTKNVLSHASSSSHISRSPLHSASLPSSKPAKGSYRFSPSPKKAGFGDNRESEAQKPDVESYNNAGPNQDPRLRPFLVPQPRKDCGAKPTQGDQVSRKLFLSPHESSRDEARSEKQQEARSEKQQEARSEKQQEARSEKQQEARREDEQTPFIRFAKAYAAIRNGNGNSYARDEEMKGNGNDNLLRHVEKVPEPRQIDVLNWRL